MNSSISHDPGLAGGVAIVTGGSRGIGRAIVDVLAANGMEVLFTYRENVAAAREVSASNPKISQEQVDVRDSSACAAFAEKVFDRVGRIDVLVNNAGVIRDNPLTALDDDDVRTVLETNISGTINMTRAVAPYMISTAQRKNHQHQFRFGGKGRARTDELCGEQRGDQRVHSIPCGRTGAPGNHGQRGGAGRDRH